MAVRYCGKAKIAVTYREPMRRNDYKGDYRCTITGAGPRVAINVGVPAVTWFAVDSERAYDDAAKAALSFATDSSADKRLDADALAQGLDGWEIARRPRAMRAVGHQHGLRCIDAEGRLTCGS